MFVFVRTTLKLQKQVQEVFRAKSKKDLLLQTVQIYRQSQQIKALLKNPSSFWKILNLSAVFYRIYFTKLLPETGTAPVDTILGDFFLSSKREKLPNKRLIKKNGTIEQNLPH